MEDVLDYICVMVETMSKAETDLKKCSEELSLMDLEAQDLLHIIENENFNILRGYHLAKQLKDVRTRRRGVKNKHDLLQIMVSSLNVDSFKKIKEKMEKRATQQEKQGYKMRVLNECPSGMERKAI